MKTATKLALAGLATALIATGSAFAVSPELRTIDNHHGVITYVPYYPSTPRHETTIAVYPRTNVTERTDTDINHDNLVLKHVSTPQGGTVSYYGPAD